MAIQKVGVVGCGLMGAGIAQVSAQAGFQTVVREVSTELLEKGLKGIDKNLARLVEKGVITEAAKGEIRSRIKEAVAEGVTADAEGAGVHVEDLVTISVLKGPLIVDLQSTVVGPASLRREDVATPDGLVIRTGSGGGVSSRRRNDSRRRFPSVCGRRVVVLKILIEIRAVRIDIGHTQYGTILQRLLDREVRVQDVIGRIV